MAAAINLARHALDIIARIGGRPEARNHQPHFANDQAEIGDVVFGFH
jgi:hypothetical protein